jgi:archaellum biogenesis ATPase FlaH
VNAEANVIPFPAVDPLDNVPAEIRQHRAFIVWRNEDGNKVPYYTHGGRRTGTQGSAEDRAQLATFDEARAACRRGGYSGIGMAMLPDWNLTALDFDSAVRDGVVHPEVLQLVSGSYAEISPSGNGVRAFMRGSLSGKDTTADGLAKYGFKAEFYPTKQFVTITGDTLDLTGDGLEILCDLTPTVREYAATRCPKSDERIANHKSPHGYRVDDLRQMLQHIDNDDRDSWRDALWALQGQLASATDPSVTPAAVEDLADEFSRRGNPLNDRGEPKYKGRSETLKKMRETNGSYGIGTLIAAAERGGWQPTAEQRSRGVVRLEATDDDFEDLSDAAPTAKKESRFSFVSMWSLADRPLPKWFIEDLIPQAELGMVYGPPGSGKSFFCFDVALHLARGLPWRGNRTRKTKVGWLAAEASGSVGLRVRAYAAHHNLKARDFDVPVLGSTLDLGNPAHYRAVIAGVKEQGIEVLFVDTLSAVSAGREENGSEMDEVLTGCKRIHAETGAMVILIHHSGKDASRGARGWSGILAAVDFSIAVERIADTRMARVEKVRDGKDGVEYGFKLNTVVVGISETNREVTSCVVEPCEVAVAAPKLRLGANEKIVLQARLSIPALDGDGVPVEQVTDAAVDRMPHEPDKRDQRRRDATRALTSCQAKRALRIADGKVFIV